MAQCPYTRYIRRYDGYTGEMKTVSFGCGRCAVCLHNAQDAWQIRITETASHYTHFIYDTLTLRDNSLLWDSPELLVDSDYIIRPEVDALLKKYDGCVPVFPKSFVSDWIKRGRDALASKYGRDNVSLKYLVFMEYGPKWSRPHAHLIMFGVSWGDYCRYFRNPWRDMFGFTKSKYISRSRFSTNPKTMKDVQCIARYISKYCSKGQFESPLVKAGLIFKPWHIVSHGLGAEYLQSDKFSFLNTPCFQSLRSATARRVMYASLGSGAFSFKLRHQNTLLCPRLNLTKQNYRDLVCYVDDAGYKHALPRYYFDKLLGREPNKLKYEIQTHLSQDACERRDKEVSRIASGLVRRRSCIDCSETHQVIVSRSVIDMAWDIYLTQQYNQSKMALARCKDRLKNHYIRPKRYSGSSIILNQ